VNRRRDYYHDSDAPTANSLVPGGSVLVTDDRGRVLMQRRSDSGNWSLPGGVMDIGETLQQCVIREAKEETGLDVELIGLLGIYTDPGHVIAYGDGEVRGRWMVDPCFEGCHWPYSRSGRPFVRVGMGPVHRAGLLLRNERGVFLYEGVPAGYLACVRPVSQDVACCHQRRRRARTRPMAVVYITHQGRAGWATIPPVLRAAAWQSEQP
jgi:hypothetical protein